ncbi:MAG: hypothetical protein LBI74_07560 [Synergistaceae bacterium]|nr:hypothetical protein [Synergistaceae bacterium]
MKRIVHIMALILLLAAGVPMIASAHPPKSVKLAWNANGNLTVTVGHSVNDPGKHYIYKVIIYVNDTVAAQKEYSSQTSADELTDVFSLGGKPSGTRIKAEAFCVIMGSASGEITVP